MDHFVTLRANVLIDLNKSNRAILAAYKSFIKMLAASGASAPRWTSTDSGRESEASGCKATDDPGSNFVEHQGH